MSPAPESSVVDVTEFDAFVSGAEPRLRRALVARHGVELGNDLCAEALAYAWQHWARIAAMENPLGYLYRVAQTAARRHRRWQRPFAVVDRQVTDLDNVDPDLDRALRGLRDAERVAVLLVHAYDWSYADAAAVLNIPVTTLRNHVHRGLVRLRRTLEH